MGNYSKQKEAFRPNDGRIALTIISWLFGLLFISIGIVNTFWGNDPGFGVFIILLSTAYFLPVQDYFKRITGITIPNFRLLKILLGIFILWAAMGVGDLPDKAEMMVQSFQ